MSSKPEVSVVMNVYNSASDLAVTIDSILSQEEVEFEFIVVNDGSNDRPGWHYQPFLNNFFKSFAVQIDIADSFEKKISIAESAIAVLRRNYPLMIGLDETCFESGVANCVLAPG
jgi:hypothetical protein